MNTFVRRVPSAIGNEMIAPSRDAIARAVEQVQSCSRHPYREQSNSEMKLRLEERRKERERIARELHDTLFQGFLGASAILHTAIEQTPGDAPTKPSLNRALQLMYRVIDEGRMVLQELRSSPAASLNLERGLRHLWDELAPGSVQFRIFVKGEPKALKPAIQEQIFGIGREAMVNGLRHSGATSIEVEVEYLPRRLRLIVRDNGCGIDPQLLRWGRDSHWGLLGMRERAGGIGAQLRIWSCPGAGTEVELSIPGDFAADSPL
jgi:signal transduction histidine kinase